jgi:hypothetical protein
LDSYRARLGMSYATELGGHPCVVACRLGRDSTCLLLFRVNVIAAVGGPWVRVRLGPIVIDAALVDRTLTTEYEIGAVARRSGGAP